LGELKKRVITGVCVAPVIAFLFYILPPLWLLALLMAICLVATLEAGSMTGLPMRYVIPFLVVAGTIPLFFRFFQIYILWVMTSTLIVIVIKVFDKNGPVEKTNRDLTGQSAFIFFGNFFILVPFFYLYLLKELDPLFPLILLVSIWASDTFAFIIGKNLGKHPLAPQISPKKTVEGLLGAAFGSLAVTTAAYQLLGFSIAGALVVGAAMGILGQAGDLLESACKRVFNTKDSSQLIPGHGGLLDRIDSFIFTAPFLYTCLVWTR
jgi:phosphatidate cytidylyltransferase